MDLSLRGRPLAKEHVAIVIPARNEAASLRHVAQRCVGEAQWVLVVDDASTDGTAETIADLAVIRLRSDTHLGKGGALTLGFRAALDLGARAIVTLDGDGQHDPTDTASFITAANRAPGTLIVGARVVGRSRAPIRRRLANRIADFWISRAAGIRIRDSQCGHRLYPREVLLGIKPSSREDGFVFESEILIEAARAGFKVTALPIEARYPKNSRPSHFRPVRDIWRITRMVSIKLFGRSRSLETGIADRVEGI